ncbi:protein I'm not dead yet-like [Calliphora vicina]|uniref:protein I'm not dead yet-like n=1 Tax=Calliphora vicina TaxID=7373 RepID=UPI00325AD80E
MADNDKEKPTFGKFCGNHWKGVFSIIVPLILLPVPLLNEGPEYRCMYLIMICCLYWITECIPLYVTSLMPMFALPLLGILDSETTCQQYFKDTLVMFLGGLMVALAVEYCNLHKRLALRTILIVGCSPRRLHFGLICVTSFISLWISNAASAAMMCPIIKAVMEELETNNVIDVYMDEEVEPAVEGKKHPSKIAMGFYFGVAYASTIGGCGTLIGTGTNLTLKGIYENRFPEATDKIDFPSFMAWALPMVVVDTLLLYICLQITHFGLFRPKSKEGLEVAKGTLAVDTVKAVVLQKYDELGPMSVHEWQVLWWFICMVVLLFTRAPGFMPGWGDILNAVSIRSSCPVMFVVLALFMFPMTCFCCSHLKSEGPYPTVREKALLAWEFINANTPWGLVFLLGGGFALAEGSQSSGMAMLLGRAMTFLLEYPALAVQMAAIVFATVLTNFSANVPICNILVPILQELAVAIKMNPIMLVFPAGIACSMAFHLPVGTPANAIIAGYAGIKSKYMASAGLLPSIFTMIMLLVNVQTMHYIVYPNREFPDWAKSDAGGDMNKMLEL